ncbi:MAG TPA: 2-dehydropantoate 2-reductase, partial [Hyphomicrobiaceae bacterium]|nr:2-dehydropantoate 2-reductase [Hyphomicrobiaceae bacterium]
MRVTVIGAGAVGGWLAATLAKGGAEVALVARGATLDQVRAHGLTLLSGERRATYRLAAAERAQELPKPDAVVLAVKTHAFADAVAAASPTLTHGPLLVTAMNGLPWWFLDGLAGPLANQSLESIDPSGKAAAMLGNVRPLGAVVHASMRAEAPGVIRISAVDRLILGEPGANVSRETMLFDQLIKDGSVQSVLTKDIRLEIWAKLWGNMNMNPVS